MARRCSVMVMLIGVAALATAGGHPAVAALADTLRVDTVAVYDPLIGVACLAGILLAERRFPTAATQPIFSVGFAQDALYLGVRTGWDLVFLSFYTAALKSFYDRYLGFLTIEALIVQPLPMRAVVMILASDFLQWFHHVVRHHVSIFWQFHMVHHSQRQMNAFTDVRLHPIDRVIAYTVQFIPLLMVEPSFPVLAGYFVFHKWYTRMYHANIRSNFGPLRYVLVTPQSHRIHHSRDARHLHHNFGVIFSLWDHLLGTQYRVYDEYPDTGVPDAAFPLEHALSVTGLVRSTLRQLLYPFRTILGIAPRPQPL